MLMNVYEATFLVTETCDNGKERQMNKKIYSPRFRDGKHITEAEIIEKGTAALKERFYYNIEYISTKAISLMWTE